ncbi:MAG TPA: TauD/TfdA family dioxygenase [Allosphingosinicella sp.]|nr:TauD/TfdA family dioxygenase [Allosphingosinicella sp.]
MKVTKVTGNIGAEISGVDLATCEDAQIYADIRAALNDHAVIFFRDQELSLERYIAFGERFGELFRNNSPTIVAMDGHPQVEIIRKEPEEKSNIGDEWHTDQAHRPNPCMGTILYSREVPPYGGDTLFANTAAAYAHLPAYLRQQIEGLEAVQSSAFLIAQTAERTGDPDGKFGRAKVNSDDCVHPVVRVHAETGRPVLYVNPAYTHRFVGWTREESIPLLEALYRHVLRPEYTCRFRWTKGAIAFWDNRQTWHYAVNDYAGHRREMHRLIVKAPERAEALAA